MICSRIERHGAPAHTEPLRLHYLAMVEPGVVEDDRDGMADLERQHVGEVLAGFQHHGTLAIILIAFKFGILVSPPGTVRVQVDDQRPGLAENGWIERVKSV